MRGNQVLLVGHDAIVDEVRVRQQFSNRRPAQILALAARGLVADRDNGHLHGALMNSPDLPPTLRSSSTWPMLMPRSTALHMSYTVSAATAAAVKASISTPVRPVTRTVARISSTPSST